MKSVPISEVQSVARVTPVVALTRKEKLSAWADLVRASRAELVLFNGLEHWNTAMLAMEHPIHLSAFALAYRHEPFRAAGLTGGSPLAAMRFFELSQEDLHTFSCNCGGYISNQQMADRIERLAS